MTNAQLFSYPNINLKFNKDLIAPDVSPDIEIRQIIWESLLGKDNKELTIISLLNNPEFLTFIEKTKKEFLKNPDKFPSMSEDDWE